MTAAPARRRTAWHDGGVDELTRLAVRARDGDRAALEAFVRRAQGDVWRLCAYLASPADADDLTQDTFVRAVRGLPAFRAESGARTWVLSIARRACADHVRRAVRRRRLLERLGPPPVIEPAATGMVDLRAVVAGLDPDRREAFVLTQVLGLPYDEAAEVAGCPIGTIRSRVARARADLLGLLEAEGPDAAGRDRRAGDLAP